MKRILSVAGKAIATLLVASQSLLAQEKDELNLVDLRSVLAQGLLNTYKQHYGYRQDIDGKAFVIGFKPDPSFIEKVLPGDSVEAGRVAADGFVDAIKKNFGKAEGDVALITPTSDIGSLAQRDKGFLDQLSAKYPDLKLVTYKGVTDGYATPAWNIMSGLITSNPKLRGVFASSPTIAQGAGQAIADNNFSDKVVLYSFDSQNKLVNFVKQPTSSNSFTMKWQKKGATASGVVVDRGATTISIDIAHCSTEKEIVIFIEPYIESQIEDVNCGQETYQQSQVIQQ